MAKAEEGWCGSSCAERESERVSEKGVGGEGILIGAEGLGFRV